MSLHNVHSLFLTRMDVTSLECPSLPLFTDRCYIDLCTDLISTLCMASSLIPRPFTPPVFDPYCKRSKTGGVEGMGMRLMAIEVQIIHFTTSARMCCKFRSME